MKRADYTIQYIKTVNLGKVTDTKQQKFHK